MKKRRIKSVFVKNLFGYEGNDYSVEMDPASPISFIYGFNGCGKTTLFRLIYAALKQQLTILDSILFELLKICFDDDEQLIVKKTIKKPFDEIKIREFQKDEKGYYFPIVYEWHSPGNPVIEGKFYFISDIFKKKPKYFVDKENKKQVSLKDFVHGTYVCDRNVDAGCRKIANELVYFYTVDILYANKDYDRIYSEKIERKKKGGRDIWTNVFESYYSLDTISFSRKYVEKIIEQRKQECNTWSDRTREEFLSGMGRDYDWEIVPLEIPDKTKRMLDIFEKFVTNTSIRDALLGSFGSKENSETMLSLFEDIINKNFEQANKKIHINRENGKVEIKFLNRDDSIPIQVLSSGEKNLLLLYFYIIFLAGHVGPVFIDEPEVSMHPDWLISFVDNLQEISKGRNVQYIIATHSPAITYGHSNLMVEMKRVKS